MGHYRVTLVAVGGHGCQREKGTGEAVVGCERPNCPDCITREYVRRLKRTGEQVQLAQIEHWPTDLGYSAAGTVVDNLLSGIRQGAFPERERELRAMTVPLSVILVDTDGTSKAVPITVLGGTTVREIIDRVLAEKYSNYGKGRRVRAYTDPDGGRHYFGQPSADDVAAHTFKSYVPSEKDGSSNELTFGDGITWRLGRPSCFGLTTEARWLPKNEPDRVAVYPYPYMGDPEPVEDAPSSAPANA